MPNKKKAQNGATVNKPSFEDWYKTVPPEKNYMGDYNLRAAYDNLPYDKMVNFATTNSEHLPDTYKLPNHPTFSNESMYYQGTQPGVGGYWNEDNYVPNPRVGPPVEPIFKKGGMMCAQNGYIIPEQQVYAQQMYPQLQMGIQQPYPLPINENMQGQQIPQSQFPQYQTQDTSYQSPGSSSGMNYGSVAGGIGTGVKAIGGVLDTIGDIRRGIITGGSALLNALIPDNQTPRPKAIQYTNSQDPYGNQTYNNMYENGGTMQAGGVINSVKSFYDDYIHSPNYKQRLIHQGYQNVDKVISDRANNIKNTRIGSSSDGSEYLSKYNIAKLDNSDLKRYGIGMGDLVSHELSHAAGSNFYAPNSNNTLNANDVRDINARNSYYSHASTFREMGNNEAFHDAQATELKADMDTLRYNLKKDGVYDTGKQQFNQDYLNKAKQKYKNNGEVKRLLKRVSDKDLIYLMNNVAMDDTNNTVNSTYAKNGTTIQINPENRGKFTASAQNAGMGVQQFASHVLANKDDYSALQIKRAQFAHNFNGSKAANGATVTNYGYGEDIPNLTPIQRAVLNGTAHPTSVQDVTPNSFYQPIPLPINNAGSQYDYYSQGQNGQFSINIPRALQDRTALSGNIGDPYAFSTNRSFGYEGLYGNRDYTPQQYQTSDYYGRVFQNGGIVNNSGYTDGSQTANNPMNIIPTNFITTQNMSQPINANGVQLEPNSGNYLFPTQSVVESQIYQAGKSYDLSEDEMKKLRDLGYEFE